MRRSIIPAIAGESVTMRIRQPGKVREQLWFLGREESGVYLLEGHDASMIVSGGMSYLVPDLLQQFQSFGIDENRITKLLILHAHFDHVGIVPFFKRRCPKLELYASARGWRLLGIPKVIHTINESSRSITQRVGRGEVYATYDLDWQDDVTGTALSEGNRIDLGDLEVRIFETPGHSSCSISGYVPRLKALFASDAGGIPYKDTIIPSGNSNYTLFQESLERLKDLDVEYICADHYGYVVGEEAKGFIRRTIELAKKRRALIEAAYLRTGDVETAAKGLVRDFHKEHPDYLISPEIMEVTFRQMIRHVANQPPS